MKNSLNKSIIERYSRQIVLKDVGVVGQKAIINSKVLIIGAGGLGCPVALYASAAGFGHIEICDDDTIDLTNLNRQIAHKNNKVGHNKAENLVQECSNINPNITIISNKKKFDKSTDINKFDLIFDCSDNAETKYTINLLSHLYKKTLISGSAVQMEGQLAIWKSGVNKDYPCYECVFPKTEEVAPITNCREAGIIGPITGLIGSMQVNEGIKEIALKNYDTSAGYLFLYDGLVQSLDKIKLTKNKKCPVCSI